MSQLSAKDALALWFTYLHQLKSACSFNTNVPAMDDLKFANSKITTVLPTTTEQNQFIVAVQSAPGFNLSPAELTQYSTFAALLNHYNPLSTYVGIYLRTLAVDPGPSAADFWSISPNSAFPGGSSGSKWQAAVALLASVIPPACFTAGLQAKVAATFDKAKSTMKDVITQIAVLG